ncbi:MAG: RDD family protein [Gemmatimonadales bacterium]
MKLRFPRGAEVFQPHADDQIVALTGKRLAPFGRRALAFVLDFGIATTVFVLLAIPVAARLRQMGMADRIHLGFFDNWYSIAWLVAYFSVGHYWGNGRTIGKRLFRMRVVSLHHERLSLWHAIERALGYAASGLEAGFGFLQYFIHPYRQTVHDRIAETIVVDERFG